MTQPTQTERDSAAARQAIADRAAAELALAVEACGPGHRAYFRWVIHDRRGMEPDFPIYGYRDQAGPHPGLHDLPDWTGERDTSRPMIHPKTGERGFLFRFEVWYQHLEAYHPQTADQLAQARAKRQAKRLDAERAALPLFASQLTLEV